MEVLRKAVSHKHLPPPPPTGHFDVNTCRRYLILCKVSDSLTTQAERVDTLLHLAYDGLVRFEGLTTVNINITVLWEVTPCSLINRYYCFGEACYLKLQFTYTEDGDRRFLRNFHIKLHDVTSQNILIYNGLLDD
jgi:hypothetical protein